MGRLYPVMPILHLHLAPHTLGVLVCTHCFYRQPGEGIQIGPNWDLSKALNNRYRLPAPPASPAPGHFGVLLIKMHLLAFVVVAIKWIIRPKTKKNLFSWSLHLNPARTCKREERRVFCPKVYVGPFPRPCASQTNGLDSLYLNWYHTAGHQVNWKL